MFRRISAVVVSAVIVIGLSVILLGNQNPPANLSECLIAKNQTISQQVIDREAKCLTDAALQGNTQLQAAEKIRALLIDPNIDVQACHLLGHAVGRAMYISEGDAAIIPGQTWCEDSYYHGMMSQQVRDSSDSASTLTDRLCAVLTAPGALRALDGEQCRTSIAHGTGHAVYANTNSITESFSICASLASDQHEQCAYGSVMEQIIQSETVQNEKLVQVSDCAAQANNNISAGCYSGLAEISVDKGVSLNELCSLAKLWAEQRCQYSYGSYLTVGMSNTTKPQYMEQLSQCSTSQDCARGLGAMRFLWEREIMAANEYCEALLNSSENLTYCLKGALLASQGKSGLERKY